ncbi:hypothetical protein CURTO8I2_70207 [Curtobacterium sp. 8I-2]|nr:hypothetical protein CURTO8I2_70207 [Curtobacterium sp. 8I-2]
MIARPHVTAASRKETITPGPAKFAAAFAPTEKMPAPTATAMPIAAMSNVFRERFRDLPCSSESAREASIDLMRIFVAMGGSRHRLAADLGRVLVYHCVTQSVRPDGGPVRGRTGGAVAVRRAPLGRRAGASRAAAASARGAPVRQEPGAGLVVDDAVGRGEHRVRRGRHTVGRTDVDVRDLVPVGVQPVRHGVVAAGVAHGAPGDRELAVLPEEFERPLGAQVLAAAVGLDVGGDDGRVDAPLHGTVGVGSDIVEAADTEATTLERGHRLRVELRLAGEVRGVRHLDALLDRHHRALRLVEEHQVGVLGADQLAHLVGVVPRQRKVLGDGQLTHAAVVLGADRAPHGTLLADRVHPAALGEATCEQRTDDLGADEGIAAAGVEDDRDALGGERDEVRDDARDRDGAGDRAGDGPVDVEQETEAGCVHQPILSQSAAGRDDWAPDAVDQCSEGGGGGDVSLPGYLRVLRPRHRVHDGAGRTTHPLETVTAGADEHRHADGCGDPLGHGEAVQHPDLAAEHVGVDDQGAPERALESERRDLAHREPEHLGQEAADGLGAAAGDHVLVEQVGEDDVVGVRVDRGAVRRFPQDGAVDGQAGGEAVQDDTGTDADADGGRGDADALDDGAEVVDLALDRPRRRVAARTATASVVGDDTMGRSELGDHAVEVRGPPVVEGTAHDDDRRSVPCLGHGDGGAVGGDDRSVDGREHGVLCELSTAMRRASEGTVRITGALSVAGVEVRVSPRFQGQNTAARHRGGRRAMLVEYTCTQTISDTASGNHDTHRHRRLRDRLLGRDPRWAGHPVPAATAAHGCGHARRGPRDRRRPARRRHGRPARWWDGDVAPRPRGDLHRLLGRVRAPDDRVGGRPVHAPVRRGPRAGAPERTTPHGPLLGRRAADRAGRADRRRGHRCARPRRRGPGAHQRPAGQPVPARAAHGHRAGARDQLHDLAAPARRRCTDGTGGPVVG